MRRAFELVTLAVICVAILYFTLLTVGLVWLRKNVQIRQLRKSIRKLEAELDDLRNQPLREELRAAAKEAGATSPDSSGTVS